MSDFRDEFGSGTPGGYDAEAFVNRVLSNTAGGACERARGQLADLMDDQLVGLDRQLVQAHLAHCTPCRALAVTFGWLTPLLPRMAVVEPGPDFLAGVLVRTSGSTRSRLTAAQGGEPAGLAGLMDRVGRWWQEQIQRPVFALQVAYVATVLLVLLTATPLSPLRGVPGRALELVSAGPQADPLLGPALAWAGNWVEVRSTAVVTGGHRTLAATWQELQGGLAPRLERTRPARQLLGQHLKAAGRRLQEREIGGAGYEALHALRDWNEAWTLWWRPAETANGS